MWTGTDEQFAKFFAIVLKRLKTEFPELKIGGPAHCSFRADLIDMLKAECDKLDVTPDFYSYHMYANNLDTPKYLATAPREYLDKIGWTETETVLNEWHFIRAWSGVHSNITEESYRRSVEGKDGLMGINSAAFNIATFCIWQDSKLDSAYYYGCGTGSWGITYPSTRWNKNYYSLLMMRDMVYDFPNKAAVSGAPVPGEGGADGAVSGTVSGDVPGAVSGTVSGTVSGSVPGAGAGAPPQETSGKRSRAARKREKIRFIYASACYLVQVLREKRTRIGKISSLPASISRIRVSLERTLYAP